MEADFSEYATKNDLLCSDGRTIKSGALKHQDRQRVPLVWQHQSDRQHNVIGHAILELRANGVYAYAYLNDTDSGQQTKSLIQHGDVDKLSIFANRLKHQNGKNVVHGNITEVSVVLAGANPGAEIDYVNL